MKINRYANRIYQANLEMQAFYSCLRSELEEIDHKTQEVFYNNFALTAGQLGIKQYETVLAIKADPLTEELEFRRQRVINWLALIYPFSEHYLRDWLAHRFSAENVTLLVDNENYVIYIDIYTKVQHLYQQTLADVREIIPANLLLYSRNRIPQDVEKCWLAMVGKALGTVQHTSLALAPKPVVHQQKYQAGCALQTFTLVKHASKLN